MGPLLGKRDCCDGDIGYDVIEVCKGIGLS